MQSRIFNFNDYFEILLFLETILFETYTSGSKLVIHTSTNIYIELARSRFSSFAQTPSSPQNNTNIDKGCKNLLIAQLV